jgi:hypothetical protein
VWRVERRRRGERPGAPGAWEEAPSFYHEFWVQNCEVFDDYVWTDGIHVDRDQRDRFQMTPEQVLGAVRAESAMASATADGAR